MHLASDAKDLRQPTALCVVTDISDGTEDASATQSPATSTTDIPSMRLINASSVPTSTACLVPTKTSARTARTAGILVPPAAVSLVLPTLSTAHSLSSRAESASLAQLATPSATPETAPGSASLEESGATR